MNPIQKTAFELEIAEARALMSQHHLEGAFAHLERAHVICQYHVVPHVVSHWLMLVIALRQYRFIDVVGQVVRMVFGALGSAVGVVPTGNTGGTNVSMFKRMPIPPELRDVIAGRATDHSPQGGRS